MKIRHFLLSFAFGVIYLLSACAGKTGGEDYFSYRDTPFRAEIGGTLHGISFSAEIGQSEEDKGAPYITYLSPPALKGITLTRREDGSITFKEEGFLATVEGDALSDLFLPLSLLLDPQSYARVQKAQGGTLLTLQEGSELRLSDRGLPLSVNTPVLQFTVVWWEHEKNP